jgi:Xaa-Pro aminopeptidase
MGIDDYSFPMWTGLTKWLGRVQLVDAGSLMETVRLIKTPDELECMRRSWRITEEATRAVEKALQPGERLNELTGLFLQRTFELGADQNFLDPIFQAMPERIADGPWSTNGDVPFALVTNDHIIRQGDVVWTDTVAGYEGYASDVGRSWFVGKPNRRQHDLFKRWKEITDTVIGSIRPGTTGADLARIATEVNGGVRPWLDHYFLGHTLGLEGGESQRVGSDLGEESNNNFTLAPGMALVVEPVTWEDGYSGYRCEELLIVTESGCEKVSQYPNEPFEWVKVDG